MKNSFIFLLIMFLFSSCSQTKQEKENDCCNVKLLKIKEEKITYILEDFYNDAVKNYVDKDVVVLRIIKKGNQHLFLLTICEKDMYNEYLGITEENQKRTIGFFIFKNYKVFVLGENLDIFFEATCQSEYFDFLKVKENIIKSYPPPPPSNYASLIWIYSYKNGEFKFIEVTN